MMRLLIRTGMLMSMLAGVCWLPVRAQITLKLMTYNIYHGEHPAGNTSNLEEIAELIRTELPDFVALQEVDSLTGRSATLNGGVPLNQVRKLAVMTGMHGYFGKAIDYDGGGYGEGMLTRKPVRIRKVMLPIPGGGEKRALLIASANLSGGNQLTFAGTHLCHQYHENRLAQARKINEVFADHTGAVMLAGDLNFTPESEPYDLLQRHWLDAAVQARSVAPTYPYDNPSRRIDYLLLNRDLLDRFEIAELRVLEVDHSDHLPVVMTLRARD